MKRGGKGTKAWLWFPSFQLAFDLCLLNITSAELRDRQEAKHNGRETGSTPCHLHFGAQTLNALRCIWVIVGIVKLGYNTFLGFDFNKSLLPHYPDCTDQKQDPKHLICM